MARLWTCGMEMQSTTALMEWTATTGTVSINTTIKRSGAASLRCNPSSATGYIAHQFRGDTVANAYLRAYLYIASTPAAQAVIMAYGDSASFYGAKVRLGTDRKLTVTNDDASTTSTGATVLSTGTWYRLELFYDETANTATLKIDGVTEIDAFGVNDVGGGGRALFGVSTSTTADLYFDDMAVDNAAYPGAGSLVLALPTGAGDNAADTGDASMINEIPPSDTATSGSTMIELDTTTSIGDYAMTDSSTLGIDSYDTINLIDVVIRTREETSGTSNYIMRIKSASGGTVSASSAVDAGNATPATNTSSTTPFIKRHVSLTDPTTAVAWTPTGTNSIDNMQVGAATTDGTPDTWVLWLGAYVEYQEGAAPAGGAPQRMLTGIGT